MDGSLGGLTEGGTNGWMIGLLVKGRDEWIDGWMGGQREG